MDKKSDSLSGERISATDASRTFSKVLDQVESGRAFLIQRHGRDVCVMAPPPVERRRASECLRILRGRTPVYLDEGFGADLLDVISMEPVEERPGWES